MTVERAGSFAGFLRKHSIGVVLFVAAVLRVWHVLALRPLPLFDGLMIDSLLYDQWAQTIAAGDWMGDRAFFSDPLYPYLLAFLYRCFGHNLLVVRLFQAALGVATCGLAGAIGRRVGGNAVGTTAALLMAGYQPLVFEGGEIEKTALGVFLVTASLACATRRTAAFQFGAGGCLALATLARGNLLLLVPCGAIFFLLDSDSSEVSSPARGFIARYRERVMGRPGRSAATFLVGVIAVLSPVLWRNHHVSGEWILTTSQAGTNFYTGNNPTNESGAFSPVPFVRHIPSHEQHDYQVKAEEIAGRPLTASEVSRFWFREALKHIVHNPRFALAVFFHKFVLFWSDLEVPDGWSMYFIQQYSPALRVSVITFGWLLPLAVLGVVGFFRADRRIRLLVGYVAIYCLSLLVFYVHSRYRIYVVPPLAILAALGLRWIWDQVRERHWRSAIPGVVLAACTGVFSFAGAAAFVGFRSEGFVHNYAHLAKLFEDKGDYASAEALLFNGLQRNPGAASILCELGSLYVKRDDPKHAIPYLDRCLQADEYYYDAWFLYAQANEALGNIDQALRGYRRQLEIVPGHQFAEICLRNLMSLQERTRH